MMSMKSVFVCGAPTQKNLLSWATLSGLLSTSTIFAPDCQGIWRFFLSDAVMSARFFWAAAD